MTTAEPGGPLPPELLALVAYIASPLGATGRIIATQAAAATVLVDSPTMLDVQVAANAPRIPLANGPIPVDAIVLDEAERLTGEILVWIEGGMLIGIEQAWYTDEPPTGWPPRARVRLT